MIIGIDLGTTNSLVAYYTDEGPKVIPNRFGDVLTPSVVSIDENDQIYVGKTAIERMQLYPETSAAVFKRSMGSDKKFDLGSKQFTAEELSIDFDDVDGIFLMMDKGLFPIEILKPGRSFQIHAMMTEGAPHKMMSHLKWEEGDSQFEEDELVLFNH